MSSCRAAHAARRFATPSSDRASRDRFAAVRDDCLQVNSAQATQFRIWSTQTLREFIVKGLAPKRRSDRGHAQALSAEQRALLLDIRREYPTANAALIVRTLELDGRLLHGTVSVSTLRRLYAEQGLDRASLDQGGGGGGHTRLRWQADRVDAVWHSDVCHGPALRIAGRAVPLRIHALLDDHSRYVVAIQACATERESEMLALVVKALRLHQPPQMLYLDNGATYNGAMLSTACGRLGITLLHAKPYDPQARGKMERFWRTLRQGCLDHMGTLQSLQEVQVRLLAFLDQHYHQSAHASLMGRTPAQVYAEGRSKEAPRLDDAKLSQALTVRAKRRVRRDGTVDIGGTSFETTAGFLAGRVVQVSDAGNCYDNAVAESFFASLKKECSSRTAFATRTEAYDAVARYIDGFYNPTRRHSTLGYVSPLRYEQQASRAA